MMVLTSHCGDDGNALKHDGVQLENMNLLLDSIINTPTSAEHLKAEMNTESGEDFD